MTLPGSDESGVGLGFRFDLNLCTGCSACELACSTENQLGWGRSWRQVVPFNATKLPSIPSFHLSMACNHCLQAPCMKACPALAIWRPEPTGAVLIEPQDCIGCKYCSWVCPYEAPLFDDRNQIMGKCTWCDHRLAESRDPACVEQCPTNALSFGVLQGAEIVPGFPAAAVGPAIRFEPLREGRAKGPECSWEVPPEVVESFVASRPARSDGVSLRTEWPLWIFTLIVSGLVGATLAGLAGADRTDPRLFAGLATIAAAASTVHLGKKRRAWRAGTPVPCCGPLCCPHPSAVAECPYPRPMARSQLPRASSSSRPSMWGPIARCVFWLQCWDFDR